MAIPDWVSQVGWDHPPYLFVTDGDEITHGPFLPDHLDGRVFTWNFEARWDGVITAWVEFLGQIQRMDPTLINGDQELVIEIRVEPKLTRL